MRWHYELLNMQVGLVPIDGILLGAVFVTRKEIDEAPICENCGKRKVLNHPSLNKREEDWCLECNDEMLKRDLSNEEWARWCLEQTMAGRTVMVVCTD